MYLETFKRQNFTSHFKIPKEDDIQMAKMYMFILMDY